MAGLSIDKKRDLHLVWIAVAAVIAVIILAVSYYSYDYYVNGNHPPLISLPASSYADSTVDETPVTLGDINAYTVSNSHPRYISIPSLNVLKARVQVIGLNKLNTLDMPRNLSDTAWYNNSANPGQGSGQVVIDGYNTGIGHSGIFSGLDTLRNGDKITIERGDGKKFTYDVVKNVTMPLQQANTSGLQQLLKPYDNTKERLGLITTAGKWIPRDKVFDQRILVWAVAE
ncbi:MAG: Sortase family enzyme [Candidatus Saccharibacteria bacterium]|nr:Sortase family enzyme [Candidatus Saccharibacteria bacterium]